LIKSSFLRYLLIGVGILTVQIVLLRHLKIYNAESDLVLVYLIWLCTKKNRTETLLIAGILAFFQDALLDLWGMHLFSKVLLIFIIHGFLHNLSEKRFIFWQIFVIVFLAAILHNTIFWTVGLFSEAVATDYVFWNLILGGSLFTAVTAGFLHLVRTDQ